jgi:hypothetical protein
MRKREVLVLAAVAAGGLVASVILRGDTRQPATPSGPSRLESAASVPRLRPPSPAFEHEQERAPGTPPPRLTPESLLALRDEVQRDVRRCTDDAIGRHPDASGQLVVAYRLRTVQGRLYILDATTSGLEDDTLGACIAVAGRDIELAAPDDEDGMHSATLFFDVL